jgi:hypothetical protein
MHSIELKEAPAASIAARSPPPAHDRYTPATASTSPSVATSPSGGAKTLPVYSPGMRGYYDPDKSVPPLPVETTAIASTIAVGNVGHDAPSLDAAPYAELHGTHAAYEMSGEPVGPPQELDPGALTRMPPLGMSNHKYRF